ncbi:hypothetical protein Tco_0929198 [Tanacetum coccineum]
MKQQNVLSILEAANVLSSGSFPTAAPAGVATASGSFPTTAIFTTASVTTPYTRRTRASRGIIIEHSHTTSVPTISAKGKGKEKMVESTEQGEKDVEIARAQAEKELRMMIAELDRSNELIAKYMTEYEQAEADLSLEEKMELITELIKYQRNLAEIKKVGNHTEVYQTFEEMLKRFNREDLDRLWSLVKKTFSTTDPIEDKEKELWVELKRLYEPDLRDQL